MCERCESLATGRNRKIILWIIALTLQREVLRSKRLMFTNIDHTLLSPHQWSLQACDLFDDLSP